jgi:hypothetical protein
MKTYNAVIKLIMYALMVSCSVNTYAIENTSNIEQKQTWLYTAYLDDEPIGYHTFEVQKGERTATVITEAEFDVSFMLIPVYSYDHSNRETWKDGCLVNLESRTNDDGEESFVRLVKERELIRIETGDGTQNKTSCIRSFAYWDPELINSSQLLNSQTGEIVNVSYKFVGEEKIQARNNTINANRYLLLGKDGMDNDIHISLWYGTDNEWLALESKLDNGRYLRYILQDGLSE